LSRYYIYNITSAIRIFPFKVTSSKIHATDLSSVKLRDRFILKYSILNFFLFRNSTMFVLNKNIRKLGSLN